MRPTALITSLILLALSGPALGAKTRNSSDILRVIHRHGDQKLTDLYRDELAEAKRQRRQVIVMFSADWCSPCKAIKRYLRVSKTVKKAMRRGRVLYIDVDEWRGPAHKLIPTINPTQLPTIVRVDQRGQKVVKCFGSELGLLSDKAVAANLRRLLDGKAPGKAYYDGNGKLERKLMLAEDDAREARLSKLPPLEAKVVGRKGRDTLVRLVIRNHDGPRRWFLVPASLAESLREKVTVQAWQTVRFNEHVRADFLRFVGSPGFVAIPVAGYGAVELARWPMWGQPKGKLMVWQLNELKIDGNRAEFQRKLPYILKISDGTKTRVQRANAGAKVEFTVGRRFSVVLKK